MIDVAIIGDGLIGLSTALELGQTGASIQIFGTSVPGSASEAAAGLLSPSVGTLPPAVQPFFNASLELYPDFVARLTQFDSELAIVAGLIELGEETDDARTLGPRSRRIDSSELGTLEPNVVARPSIIVHERDGSVDNVRLVAALRRAVAWHRSILHEPDNTVAGIDLADDGAVVVLQNGKRLAAERIVLAAGAWVSQLGGLPRALPVTPLKGQMLAVSGELIHHPIMADDVYLVPRVGEVIVGATVERAGFDTSVTQPGIDGLWRAAVRACPRLATARVSRTWAGIRPATPDMLPIICRDPGNPRLIYACGHSKNGILLAPITAVAAASLAVGATSPVDIAPFSIDRFVSAET